MSLRRAFLKARQLLSQVPFLPPPRPGEFPVTAAASVSAPPNFKVVSSEPLILVADEFLSPNECEKIIEAALTDAKPLFGENNPDVKYEMTPDPVQDRVMHAELLESVYDRIDAVCGAARNPTEVPPKVHFYAPDADFEGQRMPLGLHVDTNASPYRYATSILYLKTLPPSGDGATVFPCVKNPSISESASTLLSDQVLHTDLAQGENRRHSDVLLQAAEDRTGLSIHPQCGKLLIFFTMTDSGEVDPTSWHGGAAVVGDVDSTGGNIQNGKWMLQTFKEIPPGVRGGVAQANFVAAKRKHTLGGGD